MTNNNGNFKIFDAGFVQRREWMLYKIREDHYPFNMGRSFKLESFNPLIFQRFIDLMVKKHEILRTTLKVIDGTLKQVVHDSKNFQVKFSFYDVSKKKASDAEVFIKERKLIQFSLPFNFEFGPLFRAMVISRSKNQFEIVFVFHHVIFDQHSAEIFQKDAESIWKKLSDNGVAKSSENNAQYKEYSAYENRLLETELGNDYRKYWKGQLQDGFHRLKIIDETRWHLYLERHKNKVAEVKNKLFSLSFYDERFMASVIRRFKPESACSLRHYYLNKTFENIIEFKKSESSFFLSLFLTGFVFALNKLSGQENFIIELPAMRKMDNGFNNTIGWLTGGGPCYLNLDKNKSIEDFLKYVDEQLFKLSSHCIYPVETLGYEQDIPVSSITPVFLTLITLDENLEVDLTDSDMVKDNNEETYCYQDLTVFIYLFNNGCRVDVTYNDFLIERNTAKNISLELELMINRISIDFLMSKNLT